MPAQEPDVDPIANHPRYRRIKYLNAGSFGFVIQAEDKQTGEVVAIKFVTVASEKDMKHAHREIMNHQALLHPHVVHLREVFCAPPYLALVMEFVPNGDMFNYVVSNRGLPETEARWFFQQLILGMDYCHKVGVANRDIKLENTLLVLQPDKKPLLKMCDFGYAKHDTLDSIARSKVGTPGYTAPEVILAQGGYDGKVADVWSAGVMLYTMLFARYPFERPEDKALRPDQRTQAVLRRIINVDYVIPESPKISDSAKDLLRKVIVKDPHQRLTLAQVMQHPWFQMELPPGSLQYNDWALNVPNPNKQSSEDVDAVIKAAYDSQRASKSSGRLAGFA